MRRTCRTWRDALRDPQKSPANRLSLGDILTRGPGRQRRVRAVGDATLVWSAEEMGRWLHEQGGWSWFGTFTFDGRYGETGPHPDHALSHFRKWADHHYQTRMLAGRAFVAVETGRLGRTHCHALCTAGDAAAGRYVRLADSWRERYGRVQFRDFDPDRNAAFYVAKYVSKAPDLWDIIRSSTDPSLAIWRPAQRWHK